VVACEVEGVAEFMSFGLRSGVGCEGVGDVG